MNTNSNVVFRTASNFQVLFRLKTLTIYILTFIHIYVWKSNMQRSYLIYQRCFSYQKNFATKFNLLVFDYLLRRLRLFIHLSSQTAGNILKLLLIFTIIYIFSRFLILLLIFMSVFFIHLQKSLYMYKIPINRSMILK